jgi:ammonia channel protein AmtB
MPNPAPAPETFNHAAPGTPLWRDWMARTLRSPAMAVGTAAVLVAAPAEAATDGETAYILNTFSFLVHGFLVMLMAAGFAMLESGLVRTKNTATICLKNVALYALAGILFYLVGYNLMYGIPEGGFLGSLAIWSADDSAALGGDFGGGYAAASDWFFQMVFVATAASIVSGTLAVPLSDPNTSLAIQAVGILAVGAFVATSGIVRMAIKFTMGIRATAEDEEAGLDRAELGLEAYPEFGRGSQTV